MIFKIGWFIGFVEIWKGKKPYEKNVRQIPFAVHVTDWEGRDGCKERSSYRVKYSQNVWYGNIQQSLKIGVGV
jgi:hypothetical protein